MYDPESRSTIQYELVRLPLQDHVATVRKAVWSVWRDTKVGRMRRVCFTKINMSDWSPRTHDMFQLTKIVLVGQDLATKNSPG